MIREELPTIRYYSRKEKYIQEIDKISTYIHFSKEQREQARQTDLANFLFSQGEKVKKSGSEYEWLDCSQSVIDLRNLTRSHRNNFLHLVKKYMDLYKAEPKQLVYKSRTEKYAKIISQKLYYRKWTIIHSDRTLASRNFSPLQFCWLKSSVNPKKDILFRRLKSFKSYML